MADETPIVGGSENASIEPTIVDIYQNLNLANFKKGLIAIEQQYVRREMTEQRQNLQTVKGVKESLVVSDELAQSPVLDQTLENIAVAISKQAIKANSPDNVAQKNPTHGADPVDLATGQLVYSFTDLHLNGAGINFDFTRRYRSKGLYPNGPLGACWDYSLNLWLRESSATEVIINSADFREDHFNRVQGNDGNFYFAPPDGYHAILENQNGIYILTRPDGMRYEYVNLDSSIVYKISKISDRFDNFLSFDYTDPSTLRVVVNEKGLSPTRVVQIRYDDLKRIIALVDYSGRSVLYDYDDYDDLTSVTLPPTKDYPRGRSFFYQYSSESGPVSHQLLTVIDADGRRYLEIEYGKNENFIDNERVIRQRDDEGEWLIEYADLVCKDPEDITKPNRYAVTFKPSGHYVEYWFNKNGNALVKAESMYDENNFKRKYITRTLYNLDGNIIAEISPEKQFTQYIYGRDLFENNNSSFIIPTKEERKTFGNLLTQIRRYSAGIAQVFDVMTGTWTPPSPFTWFDPQNRDIVIDYTYEKLFQQIETKSDPRFRFNANYFTKYIYTNKGELQQIKYPETTGPDPSDISTSSEIDFFEYKAAEKGKVFRKSLKRIDPIVGMTNHPDSHITEYSYFSQTDSKAPEQQGIQKLFLIPAPSITLKGHLRSVTLGKGEVDECKASFKINTRGVKLKITDARLNSIEYKIDSTDLPVSIKKNLTSTVGYETNFKYTREGKVKWNTREVRDESGNLIFTDPETMYYRYNDFGLMTSQRIGGSDFNLMLRTKKVYNAEGLPERVISPGGSVTHLHYNQKRLGTEVITGFGTPEAVYTSIKYNGDGKKTSEKDAAGNTTRFDYDTFGRLISTVKVVDIAVGVDDQRSLAIRQGHTEIVKYDKLNSIVEERFFEWQQPNTYKLLSLKQYEYDQRGRKIRDINFLFDAIIIVNTGINWQKGLYNCPIPNSIKVESWIFYDGNSKIKEQRDGVVTAVGMQSPGSSVSTIYDHSGRATVQTIRLLDRNLVVCETKNTYDPNGNLVRIDKYDYEYDKADNLINSEIISSGAEFDSLNRKVKDIDGYGNIIKYNYDSRDALIARTDALGNITTYNYDIFGRKIRQTESVASGQLIITGYEYNADGQVISVLRGNPALNNFIKTSNEYNALQKRTKKILASGTNLKRVYKYVYDKTGLLKRAILPNKLSADYTYNHLNQVIRVDYDNSNASATKSDASEIFSFDGLGRTIKATNDKTEVRYEYDSFGRIIKEEQDLLGVAIFKITRRFDFLNNLVELIYPSGRTVQYNYDLAGRQGKITDVVRGIPNVSKLGAGSRTVLAKRFIGMRQRSSENGNGTSTIFQYDRNGRIISIDHINNSNSSQLQFIQLYDENGNRGADWQAGIEKANNSSIYDYDGLNRLTKGGQNKTAIPTLASLSPFSIPNQPLTGQALVNTAMGNRNITVAAAEPTYSYDEWSNRQSEKAGVLNTTEKFNQLGELNTLTYDNNGNLIISGTKLFSYDQHNRLIDVTDGVNVFSCIYDVIGRRILKKDNNTAWRFAFDAFAEIAAYNQNILAEEFTITSQPDGRISYAVNNQDYFIHHDTIGSTRMITDDNGNKQGRYEYQPYGRIEIKTNFSGFRYLFMGREWDQLIQLYHFRARHYDFETGRFLQNDPVESTDAKSLYHAFGSNPLIYVDPFGTRQINLHDIQKAKDRADYWFPDLDNPPFDRRLGEGPLEKLMSKLNDHIFREDHSTPVKSLYTAGALVTAIPASLEFMVIQVHNGLIDGPRIMSSSLTAAFNAKSPSQGFKIGAQGLFMGAMVTGSSLMVLAPSPKGMKMTALTAEMETALLEEAEFAANEPRPDFWAGTKSYTWEASKNAAGRVIDPSTSKVINPGVPWAMGHLPGYEYSKLVQFARAVGLSREEFINMYNNPLYYQAEFIETNAAHAQEAVFGENYYMKDFVQSRMPMNPIKP
jgi:RHS repeat-associated protein